MPSCFNLQDDGTDDVHVAHEQPTTKNQKKKRNVSYIYTMIKCVSCFFPYSLLITCHLTLDLAQLELSESLYVHLGNKQNDYHLQCN